MKTYKVYRHAFYGPDFAGVYPNENPIRARGHDDAYKQLSQRLSIDGPRTLYAFNGKAEIISSLYDGCSLIRDGKKRILHVS